MEIKLLALLLMLTVYSVSVNAAGILNDTFVATGGSGFSYNTSASASHGSDTILILDDGGIGSQYDNFTQAYKLQTFFRLNNSAFNNKVVLGMKLQVNNLVLNGSCADSFDGQQYIRWVNQSYWYDDMNYAQSPLQNNVPFFYRNISFLDVTASASQKNSTSFNLTDYYLVNSLYNDTTSSVFINAFHGRCNGAGATAWIDSLEGTSPPSLVTDTATYVTYASNNTDVPTVIWIDFETGQVSQNAFLGYDVALYTAGSYYMSSAVPQGFYAVEYDDINNMANVACSGVTFFPPMLVNDINQQVELNPDGRREIYCFNLSAQHGGKPFYGAMKVLNLANTRGGSHHEADIYFSLYSSSFSGISQLTVVPTTAGEPIAALWTTSEVSDGILYWRYRANFSDEPSTWQTVAQTTADGLDHAVFIPAIQSFAGYYEAYGYSCGSICLSTPYVNFTIGVAPPTGAIADLNVTQGIHIRVTDNVNVYLKAWVALNNTAPIETSFKDDTSAITGRSQVASYYNFSNGVYPLQVYQTGYTSFNGNITVTSQPFVYDVKLTPYRTCMEIYSTLDNDTCGANTMFLSQHAILNFTSWYCAFDANKCYAWDNTTGYCSKSGMWVGFGCLDGYHPAGVPINGTASIGSQGGTEGFFTVIASFFSTTLEGAKSLFAFVLMVIVVGFIAYKTKDGLITSVMALMMIGLFAVVGWIPIWLVIVLVVATAFLIAKFVRQAFTPQ